MSSATRRLRSNRSGPAAQTKARCTRIAETNSRARASASVSLVPGSDAWRTASSGSRARSAAVTRPGWHCASRLELASACSALRRAAATALRALSAASRAASHVTRAARRSPLGLAERAVGRLYAGQRRRPSAASTATRPAGTPGRTAGLRAPDRRPCPSGRRQPSRRRTSPRRRGPSPDVAARCPPSRPPAPGMRGERHRPGDRRSLPRCAASPRARGRAESAPARCASSAPRRRAASS